MIKASTTGSSIILLNAILMASATKHLAFTLEGFLIMMFGIGLSVMAYLVGKRDGRNETN